MTVINIIYKQIIHILCENIINFFKKKILKYKSISVILKASGDGVSAGAEDEILSPSPNLFRGELSPPSPSPWGKILQLQIS
jgi:hypothetical protein